MLRISCVFLPTLILPCVATVNSAVPAADFQSTIRLFDYDTKQPLDTHDRSRKSKRESKGFQMSAREIQDQKAIAREMFVQQAAHANADVSASPLRGATICST